LSIIDYWLSMSRHRVAGAGAGSVAERSAGERAGARATMRMARVQALPERDGDLRSNIDHQPLSVRIRHAPIERIVSGHYGPGDRLVELQLAREFGSSQAPVREALRDLDQAGLVTIRPRRGSFVNDYHARAQHEIYAVRGALEEAAMRLAFDRLRARPGLVA